MSMYACASLETYEDSGRFRRVKSKPEPKPPEIFSSSSYKSYLSTT